MHDPLALTPAQAFELERMTRAIDNTHDTPTLHQLCHQLLRAWMVQRSATAWAMRQGLSGGPQVRIHPSPVAHQPPMP